MDNIWLEHQITDEERKTFERDGYFTVENAISGDRVERLTAALDRITAEDKAKLKLGAQDRINILDFLGRDDEFLPLLDWHKTFPKVWGILGWNIQLYHSHTIISPPDPPDAPKQKRLGWHKDSGRLNWELETNPQPMISLKVAFFLSDTSELGRANLYVIPGSHLVNTLDHPKEGLPEGAIAVRAKAGDAVFFDRRIWHASSPNTSDITRKVLFYGYSYRWLRPRDDMTVDHYFERCNPIQRQLLGAAPSGKHGYSSPKPEDVPLRDWMEAHLSSDQIRA
ncbi:MAG: phytanoyl-CoA dioxygenase family protein [Chloroflexota bacterium]